MDLKMLADAPAPVEGGSLNSYASNTSIKDEGFSK